MEEMVKEQGRAVRRAKLSKPWLQPDADSWWVTHHSSCTNNLWAWLWRVLTLAGMITRRSQQASAVGLA